MKWLKARITAVLRKARLPKLGKVERNPEDFEVVVWRDTHNVLCTVQASSAFSHGAARPGTSYLWIGPAEANPRMHLDHAQVTALIQHLQTWLSTGSLKP